MKKCEKVQRQLQSPADGWSREILEHCRLCPECRREMLARLTGTAAGAPSCPAALEAGTIAVCRTIRPGKAHLPKFVLWSGAAVAAVCLGIGSGVLFFRPEPQGTGSAGVSPGLEWSGAELEQALSEIGQDLTAVQQKLSMDDSDHV